MSEKIAEYGFWAIFAVTAVSQVLRYFVLNGLTYGIFWVKYREWTEKRRVQPAPFRREDLKREILDSLVFNVVTAAPFALLVLPGFRSHSKIYFHAGDHSPIWIGISFLGLLLGQDAYFYWIHRALHGNRFAYRRIHLVHHRSTNPSPFATFAFHPVEAVLLAGYVLSFLFLVPTYFYSFAAYQVLALALNLNGHLGADVLPQSWRRLPVLRHLTRADVHGDHHRYFNENYGLFFTFWDRWMGTYRGRKEE